MKKCLFLSLVAFLMATNVFSQIEWVGDIEFNSYPTKLHKTKSNHYLTAGISKKAQDHYWPYVALIDSSGSLVKSQILYTADIEHLIELPDSTFLTFGIWGCDWLTTDFRKYNKNLEPDLSYSAPPGYFDWAVALSNGDIIYSNYSNQIKVNHLGDIIWEKQSGFAYNDYVLLPSDSFLIAGYELQLYDSSANLLKSIPYELEKIKIAPQGNYLCSSHDSLYLFSPSFEVQATIAFPQGVFIEDYDVKTDRIAVLTYTNLVYVYDSNLGYLSEQQFDNSIDLNQLLLENDSIVFSGSTEYGNSPWFNINKQPVLKKYGLDGSATHITEDVGVINVSQPSDVEFISDFSGFYALVYKEIYATVKNFGNTTVNDIDLNCNFSYLQYHWEDCSYKYQEHKKEFSNLNLAPGATKELYFGDVTVWHRNTTGYSPSENICIWTSSPDQKIETDRANDKACIEVLTATKEISSSTPAIKVWPNPAQIVIKLDMQETHPSAQFQVLDLQGHVLRSAYVENWQKNSELAVADLPNGMYLWRMVWEDGEIDAGKIAILR